MTLGKVIYDFGNEESHPCSKEEIIAMLSAFDGRIYRSVHAKYDGAPEFEPYPEDADLTTALLVAYPYDEIYLYYLLARNAAANGNIQRYNNFTAICNSLFEEFAEDYHREKAFAKATVIREGL